MSNDSKSEPRVIGLKDLTRNSVAPTCKHCCCWSILSLPESTIEKIVQNWELAFKICNN